LEIIEGSSPLGSYSRRGDDNIKIYLKEVRYVDWIHLAQDRAQRQALVRTVRDLKEP
jgi:hypothetical protein